MMFLEFDVFLPLIVISVFLAQQLHRYSHFYRDALIYKFHGLVGYVYQKVSENAGLTDEDEKLSHGIQETYATAPMVY